MGMELMIVGENAGEHHGACHGYGHAEDGPRHQGKAEEIVQQNHTGQGGGRNLHGCPAEGNGPHGQKILEVKVQAHAEHEQNDANFSALGRRGGVGLESGRIRPHQNACQQIAHKGRKAQLLGDETQHHGC